MKSPLEVVASTARALGAPADPTPRTARAVALLGQPLFGRPSPDGWPETGAPWMNGGAILARINFGLAVAAGRLPGATLEGWPGSATLRGRDPAGQIDGLVDALLGGEASPDTRAVLTRGENPLARRGATGANPADEADEPDATGSAGARRRRRGSTRSPCVSASRSGLPSSSGAERPPPHSTACRRLPPCTVASSSSRARSRS